MARQNIMLQHERIFKEEQKTDETLEVTNSLLNTDNFNQSNNVGETVNR